MTKHLDDALEIVRIAGWLAFVGGLVAVVVVNCQQVL